MTPSLRILIVEDEWMIAQDYADCLTAAGHGVVGPAPTAKAARESLSCESANLALLDVNLSGKKSYELADELRQRKIPFAFLTGYRAEELPKRFASVEVLQKPVSESDLIDKVSALAEKIARD